MGRHMSRARKSVAELPAEAADGRVRVEQRAGYTVLTPLDTLKDRALVAASQGGVSETDALKGAEQALADVAPQFRIWLTAEIETLADARARYRVHGAPARDDLYQAAHALRGDAGQFGFPLIGVVADSLAKLIERCPPTESPDDLISQHVDAIRAMLRESGDGDARAKELAAAIVRLTENYLDVVAPASSDRRPRASASRQR